MASASPCQRYNLGCFFSFVATSLMKPNSGNLLSRKSKLCFLSMEEIRTRATSISDGLADRSPNLDIRLLKMRKESSSPRLFFSLINLPNSVSHSSPESWNTSWENIVNSSFFGPNSRSLFLIIALILRGSKNKHKTIKLHLKILQNCLDYCSRTTKTETHPLEVLNFLRMVFPGWIQ